MWGRHHYTETWDRVSETWVIYIDGVYLSSGASGTVSFINDTPYLHLATHCYPENLQEFEFTSCNAMFSFEGSAPPPHPYPTSVPLLCGAPLWARVW